MIRVNDINLRILEIGDIARRQLGASGSGNRRDLRISMTDWLASQTAVGGNPGEDSRGVVVEVVDPSREIFREHVLGRHQQALAARAGGEHLDSIEDLCLGDRGDEEFDGGLLRNPCGNSGRGLGTPQRGFFRFSAGNTHICQLLAAVGTIGGRIQAWAPGSFCRPGRQPRSAVAS
jgi:hypothetical protein